MADTIIVSANKTEEDLKKDFATALLKNPDDPFKAALSVISDTGLALHAGMTWVNDPFVRQYQLDLIEVHGADKFVPNEVDQLRHIWSMCINDKLGAEVQLKAHELYAKIRQKYFSKPTVVGNQTNILNQGVMAVPMAASPEAWEATCIEQQKKLKSATN